MRRVFRYLQIDTGVCCRHAPRCWKKRATWIAHTGDVGEPPTVHIVNNFSEHADGERRGPSPIRRYLKMRLVETLPMPPLGSAVAPRRSPSACPERLFKNTHALRTQATAPPCRAAPPTAQRTAMPTRPTAAPSAPFFSSMPRSAPTASADGPASLRRRVSPDPLPTPPSRFDLAPPGVRRRHAPQILAKIDPRSEQRRLRRRRRGGIKGGGVEGRS